MTSLKEIAYDLVQVARDEGAKDAVAEAFDRSTRLVRFSNSEIDSTLSWVERHAHVLVAIGKRTLVTDVRDLETSKAQVRELVNRARSAPINEEYGGIASGRFKYRSGRADPAIVKLRDPAKHVHEAIRAAEAAGSDNVGGTLYVRHAVIGVASSSGAKASDENASLDLSVRAFSQPEASGHCVSVTPRLSGLRAKETGARAGELARMAKNPVQGEQGRFDVVVEPLFLGSILHSTSNMMSAMLVDIGMSMYSKKIGKKVASSRITIVDDPLMPSSSRRAFDHEGAPTRRNVIVKDGVLRTFLHNTSTAKRYRTRTTANTGPLVPTLFTIPSQPVAFHPVLEPGDWKTEEIIADTEHGLYMNNTWYTRFQNHSTGEFSTIPRDAILRIEGGEIVGAVKNVRMSDNMMNFWKSADALSKTSQEVFWWDEASPPSTLPTLRSRQMNITRSA
ncbi:MAG: TldD/PmbA family protein [Candidatus Thermoplasmatota archaeon]|nr:TldD/PmbA family protein [Candidatus Thermoplasmatota archaeon]